MPTLEIPHYELLDRLFAVVAAEDAELLPGCRWLVLGRRLATLLTVGEAPTLEQLVTLQRVLHRRREPALEDVGRRLAANSEHREAAEIQICLDLLLERPDWHHPTQVLDPPVPDFAVARRRPGAAPGPPRPPRRDRPGHRAPRSGGAGRPDRPGPPPTDAPRPTTEVTRAQKERRPI
jgi:hypothetical protein